MRDLEVRLLSDLSPGDRARIVRVGGEVSSREDLEILLEFGFIEGAEVELLQKAPWGGDPLVVRVRGAKLALRKELAVQIQVEVFR